jgi:hypothetical protein
MNNEQDMNKLFDNVAGGAVTGSDADGVKLLWYHILSRPAPTEADNTGASLIWERNNDFS